jgi:hypothetical protein
LAVAAGLGVSALLDDMRRAHFGWRQVAAVAAAVGIALPVLALAADTASGRWHLPADDWPTAMSWMSDVPTPGGFRVLWLGGPSVLPVDGKVLVRQHRFRVDPQRAGRRSRVVGSTRSPC